MPIASYTPTKQTLGQILGNTSPPIRVPDYQRDYSWQTKQVKDFWEDLTGFDQQFPGNAIQGKEYFLGSSVLVQTATHHLLLDGQQRLATATILLSAIRDILDPVNQNAANQIQNDFIVVVDHLSGGARKYKLELNIFDRDYFRSRIQDRPRGAVQPTKRSHKLIDAARKYFDSKLNELWTSSSQQQAIAKISRLANILTTQFGFVVVSSSDQGHAATIFETLNDRGIGLSTADLLRSWLLTEAQEATRNEMTRLWSEIFHSVRNEKPEIVIRASWVSRYGDVKSRSMYKEIRENIKKNAIAPIEYTRQLHKDSIIYRKLIKQSTGNPVVDEVCRGLVRLKAAGCFAPLIAATNKNLDVPKLAKALASLTVRHNTICRRDPTKLEAKAFEVSQLISSGKNMNQIIASLRKITPNDAEFRSNFMALAYPPSRHSIVQILLRTIENNKANTGEKIIASPKAVNVEHIYPQSPLTGQRWADHEMQVYRLGNLTLLSSALNSQQQNAPFGSKLSNYRTSLFKITNELTIYTQWTQAEIESRQTDLCNQAIRIWPATLD